MKRRWSATAIGALIILIIGVCSILWMSAPKGCHIYQENGKFGIKNGDSVLLSAKYSNIVFLDSMSSIALLQVKPNLSPDTSIYIYDVANNRFLFNDSEFYSITKVEKIMPNAYKLVLSGGRWFATLNLPGEGSEATYATITPHFYDIRVSIRDFIADGADSFMMHPYGTWADMKQSSPAAFRMLDRILAMSHKECSPDNDLAFVQAVEYYIDDDPRYLGNFDKAFADIEAMIEALDNDGRDDMTRYGEIKRLLSNINLSRVYIDMITDFSGYRNEYIAWHNLVEAMSRYYNYVIYNDNWSYQEQRDADLNVANWLDNRISQLSDERKILSGSKTFPKKTNSLKTENDIRKLCTEYNSSTPGRYHPMWHEVYYAFDKWMQSRTEISKTLQHEKSLSYDNYTAVVIDRIYDIVQTIHGHEPEYKQ